MPALPLVIARNPKSVSVSSRTRMTAPGFETSLDSLTNVAADCLVADFISIPFRDEVANGFGARTNYFHNIVALEERTVT